jgi:hypothetical protein
VRVRLERSELAGFGEPPNEKHPKKKQQHPLAAQEAGAAPGMTEPKPRSPYAKCGWIVNLARSPTLIVMTPLLFFLGGGGVGFCRVCAFSRDARLGAFCDAPISPPPSP